MKKANKESQGLGVKSGWELKVEQTWVQDFQTCTCHLLSQKNSPSVVSKLSLSTADVPSPPVIDNKETESLTCDVNVIWSTPADHGCPLTMYSIYHQQIPSPEMGWYQINVTNVMATNFTVTLACGRQYTIEMSAWNELGESGRSRKWIIKTMSGTFTNISYLQGRATEG